MKKISIVALTFLVVALGILAFSSNTDDDGAQKVDGVIWYYDRISNGNGGYSASITRKEPRRASYSGALTIPTRLGGCTVTAIGNNAFYSCSELTSVTIPPSITTIGKLAFARCTSLKSVTIPQSVTTIGESAFSYCSGLTSVTIPSSVTTIGKWAFTDCESLVTVAIPSSVTEIRKGAFSYCSGLKSVTIPPSVTTIGEGAFSGCKRLTSVTIPSGVTTIGEDAFCDCSRLAAVTIPSSVTTIEKGAFSRCSNLMVATVSSSATSIERGAFDYRCNLRISGTVQTCVGNESVPIGLNPTETERQTPKLAIRQDNEETVLNDCVRSICRQAGVESISQDEWNVLTKYIKERDTGAAAAYLLLLKNAARAQQSQRESPCQSQSRLDPGIAAMMNYKPSCGSSSPSRSSSSSSSWKCRYCGLVVNGPVPTPNSGSRCAGRELGPDPGPHVFDKN